MKPFFALLFTAACTMSHALPRHPGASEPPIPPDSSQCQAVTTPEEVRKEAMKDEVRAGTAVADHRVMLEGFEFDVYIDRAFSPPVVVVWQPLESMDRLLSLPSIRKQKNLLRKLEVVAANYARSMRGEPPETVPADDQSADADEEGEPEAPSNILDCIRYYPEEDTNFVYLFNVLNEVHIDNVGRPDWSNFRASNAPPTADRDKRCQSTVAGWGKPGMDQGGHGIGARLSGWGGRANLTPQDSVLNQSSEWKSLDAAADACASRKYLTNHRVWFNYDAGQVRPVAYTVKTYAYSKTCPPKLLVDVTTDVGNYLPALSDLSKMQLHSNAVKRACGG
jgi:hypothetical protein